MTDRQSRQTAGAVETLLYRARALEERVGDERARERLRLARRELETKFLKRASAHERQSRAEQELSDALELLDRELSLADLSNEG